MKAAQRMCRQMDCHLPREALARACAYRDRQGPGPVLPLVQEPAVQQPRAPVPAALEEGRRLT